MLSSSESVLFVCNDEEHGLFDDVLIVGDEGSRGVCVVFGCCLFGTIQ